MTRWTSMKLQAVGPSGHPTPLGGRVHEPDGSVSPKTSISLVITICLIGLGLFMPPFLLLGIPLLILRTAVAAIWMATDEKVVLDAFECPECHAENASGERRGALPLDLKCARCGAALSIGQVPRIYKAMVTQ